ncbi:hypothetical protein Tco_1474845 [Tanacetum coccineum]
MAKRATMDLAEDDEEKEEQTRQCARWSREEEILLTELWIETSENGQIKADRSDDSFWGQILQDFNNASIQGHRTKNMLTAQQPKGRKFMLEHAWRNLIAHSKWDAPKPLETDDHTEIFGPDVRPRLVGKTRLAKKTKSETTGSIEGSVSGASGSISDYVSEELRRKLQAGTSAYEAKKQKELAIMEFKEIEFLTIDPDKLPELKARIIRKKQEKIIAKYAQQ